MMKGGLGNLMRQAQQMQENMQKAMALKTPEPSFQDHAGAIARALERASR